MRLEVELLARLYLGPAKAVCKTCLTGRRKILSPKQQGRMREIEIANLGKTVIIHRTGEIYTQYLQAEVRH